MSLRLHPAAAFRIVDDIERLHPSELFEKQGIDARHIEERQQPQRLPFILREALGLRQAIQYVHQRVVHGRLIADIIDLLSGQAAQTAIRDQIPGLLKRQSALGDLTCDQPGEQCMPAKGIDDLPKAGPILPVPKFEMRIVLKQCL